MEIISGVYCIENVINHKKYIGQSMDIYRRWKDHKHELNGERHHNEHLQRAWNRYKELNFEFYILEQCEINRLNEVETYYINLFDCNNPQCGYNIESGGNANKIVADETKKKISRARKGKYCGGQNPKAHPAYCPQLDRWFSCLKEIEDEGIACEAGVRDCLRGKSKTAGKHPLTGKRLTWYDETDFDNIDTLKRIEDEKNGIEHRRIDPRCIPVYCPQLDRLFEGGASQVDREGFADRPSVLGCIANKRRYAGKHPISGVPLTWYDSRKMDDPIIKQIIEDERIGISHIKPRATCIPVYCIELDKVFMGGSSQVSREGIACSQGVHDCLAGRSKTAGKHPITGEPLHWVRYDEKNINITILS